MNSMWTYPFGGLQADLSEWVWGVMSHTSVGELISCSYVYFTNFPIQIWPRRALLGLFITRLYPDFCSKYVCLVSVIIIGWNLLTIGGHIASRHTCKTRQILEDGQTTNNSSCPALWWFPFCGSVQHVTSVFWGYIMCILCFRYHQPPPPQQTNPPSPPLGWVGWGHLRPRYMDYLWIVGYMNYPFWPHYMALIEEM